MKQNLIYIINQQQYTKIKKIYEIYFRKIKRVNHNDFSTEKSINDFFLEFRDYFIDLFMTKFTSRAGLIKWFETLEKKNKVMDLFDQNRLIYYRNQFIETWDQFIPKEQKFEHEGEIKQLQTSIPSISPAIIATNSMKSAGKEIILSPEFMIQLKNSFLKHVDKRFDEIGEKIEDMGVIIDDIRKNAELIRFIREETKHIKDIKDDTEMIIQMVSMIEQQFDEKWDDLENYLQMKLGTTYEKLRTQYDLYKLGKISKRKLILSGLKIAGMTFANIFKPK